MISDEQLNQLEWKLNFNDSLSIHSFARTSVNHNSIYGSGLSFVYEPDNKTTRGYLGFTVNKPTFSLGLTDYNNVSSETNTIEIGGEYSISDKVSAFVGFSQSRIENIGANYNNLGFKDVSSNGLTTGIHIKNNKNNFVIGLSRPEELKNGDLEIMSPVGKKANGDILWENRSFELKQENFMPLILGWSHKMEENLKFGANIEESRLNNGELGSVQFSINYAF